MIRAIVINAILFLLPFVVVWFWVRYLERRQPDLQTQRYWARAALIGGGLVIAGLLITRFSGGNAPDKNYIAPHYQDGEIVPGRFE